MATIKESAKAYVQKKTKSITELGAVSVELEIEDREFNDKDGKPFTIQVFEINGEEYRIPQSVVKQLKELLEEKPKMTKFKVRKTGEGMNTSYMVVPLDG